MTGAQLVPGDRAALADPTASLAGLMTRCVAEFSLTTVHTSYQTVYRSGSTG